MAKKSTGPKKPSTLGLDNHLPTEGPGREDMMQLYSWTFEDAIEAQAEFEHDGKGRGPLFRWLAAQDLKELHTLYFTGDTTALMDALFSCSLNSLPLPRWLEMAFLAAYRKVRHYKAKSWDDVFGRPHPKGTHLRTKDQERKYALRVFFRIEQIRRDEPHTAIDGAIFERVGKEFGIGGKTLTEEYYYKIKNNYKGLSFPVKT